MHHDQINELFEISDTVGIVYAALTEDCITPDEDTNQQAPGVIADPSPRGLAFISLLERYLRSAIHATEPAFEIIEQHGYKRINKINPAGRTYKLMRDAYWHRRVKKLLSTKQLNPFLDVVLNGWETISDLSWVHCPPEILMNDGMLAAEKYNRSLDDLRRHVQSTGFQNRCAQWFTESNYHYRSTKSYVAHLFDKHARLLVMRLDLGFRVGSDFRSDVLACRSCFKRFLANQDHNGLFNHLVGYIWRLEFGEKKGWHYHCIFFFDGAKRWQDVTIGDAIGEYWRDVITDGQGTYWNCNRHKERYELYKTLGVGMVHAEDECKRIKLMQAAAYLCKIDECLRQAIPDGVKGVRTFGRGEIDQSTLGQTKMGRPRLIRSTATSAS